MYRINELEALRDEADSIDNYEKFDEARDEVAQQCRYLIEEALEKYGYITR